MFEAMRHSLRGGRLWLGGFLALLLLLFVGRWGVAIYVDVLWFATVGRTDVFWTRALWEWGVRLAAGLGAGLLTAYNLRAVAGSLQGLHLRRRFGNLEIHERIPERTIRLAVLASAAFSAFWFATAVPSGTGLGMLLMLQSEPWGVVDPILGQDLSFHVFVLPVLQGLVTYGLVLTLFLGSVAIAGYALTGALAWVRGRPELTLRARTHLGILVALGFLLVGFRFAFAPYELLLGGTSGVQNIFGYADEHARIPAYRMMAFLSLATAVAAFWGVRRGRLLPAAAGAVALAIVGLASVEVYPSLVQRFQVQPNELERERPYIERAVLHTRVGFGLDALDRERWEYERPNDTTWEAALPRLSRLPVWTTGTLLPTFRQLEARFEYYDFREVVFDRYPGPTGEQPVAVSVREIDPFGLPAPVSWQNRHLRERYITGLGGVAGLLNRVTDEGRLPMFLTALPPEYRPGPEVPEGFELTRPAIHIGSRPQLHAVITPTDADFLAPDGARGTPGVDYPEGIRMGSLLRTLALAWHFQDANLFLASEVERDSYLVHRRDVRERVRALAPFLLLPEAPYPVVSEGRIVWILEGFTFSRTFPLSSPHAPAGERPLRYLRNSVKATVDAVTGETRLWVADAEDPVLAAYRRAFPGLFEPLEALPEGLRRHLRYARTLFDVQAEVLGRFHQSDPAVFHGQQDRWTIATELSSAPEATPYRPEHAFLTLPGESEESWILSTVFVPQGRQKLAGFLAAEWTPEEGGALRLWDVPAEDQVRGPRQIEAMIDQDPEISQQFSLWRQSGSQVWTGHLHLIPIGHSLLYMEPVFLAANADAIPEIRRFLVSDGERVVMDPTLPGAVLRLALGTDAPVAVAPEALPLDPEAPAPAVGVATGSAAALAALERAEASLRNGDWEGFGRGLEELRRILETGPGTVEP